MAKVDYSVYGSTELDEEVVGELESFKEDLENNYSSDKTVKDYFNYVKGFYRNSKEKHDRDKPVNFDFNDDSDRDQQIDQIKEELLDYIGSPATEYGLKRYLRFKRDQAGRKETEDIDYLLEEIHKAGVSVKSRSKTTKIGNKIHDEKLLRTSFKDAGDKTQTLDPDELELFLKVMYETAGRFSDIARLEWIDVDKNSYRGMKLEHDEQIVISAKRSKSRENGVVRVNSDTLQELQKHREKDRIDDSPRSKVFFQDREDTTQLFYRVLRAFRSAAEENGLEVEGTHDIRHSRLVHLGEKILGDDDNDFTYSDVKGRLQSYARHEDSDTTEIYIELLKERNKIDISKYVGYNPEEAAE